MFAQIIRGKTSDPDGVRACLDRWSKELAPTAKGWLGSTAGVTEHGELFALVRFESEAAAQANSDRPEQGEWWSEMQKVLDGDAVFQNSSTVAEEINGNLDEAGFVQVMTARSSDPEQSMRVGEESREARRAHRPDVLGNVLVGHGEGRFTMVIYFTSEADAREGERKPPPPEMWPVMQKSMALIVEPPKFLDLKQPWLHSPR